MTLRHLVSLQILKIELDETNSVHSDVRDANICSGKTVLLWGVMLVTDVFEGKDFGDHDKDQA